MAHTKYKIHPSYNCLKKTFQAIDNWAIKVPTIKNTTTLKAEW